MSGSLFGGDLLLVTLQDFLGLVQTRIEQVPIFEDRLHFGDWQLEHHARDFGCVFHAHNLHHEVVNNCADLLLVARVLRNHSGQDAVRCQHKLLIHGQLFLSLILVVDTLHGFGLRDERLLEIGHLLHLLVLLHLTVIAHFGFHLRLLTLAKHRRQVVHKVVLVVATAHSSSILVRIIIGLLVRVASLPVSPTSLIVLPRLVVAILAVVRVLRTIALVVAVAAEGRHAHVTAQHKWHLLKDHLQVELKFFLLVKGRPLSSDGILGAERLEILLVLELLVLHFANFTNLVVVNHKFAAAHIRATQLFAGRRRLIWLHVAHKTVQFAFFARRVQFQVFNLAKRFEHV